MGRGGCFLLPPSLQTQLVQPTMTIPSINAQSQAAKLAVKKAKASRLFDSAKTYDKGLIQRLSIHCCGNPEQPFRRVDVFAAHNTAEELAQIGLLSETALMLENMDGRRRHMVHLWPVCKASSYPGGKINNLSNLAVALGETNAIVGKRIISRGHLEVLDRIVLAGNYITARVFANQVCY